MCYEEKHGKVMVKDGKEVTLLQMGCLGRVIEIWQQGMAPVKVCQAREQQAAQRHHNGVGLSCSWHGQRCHEGKYSRNGSEAGKA